MSSLLVHVTHGPESPTRAALAFLVARTAAEEGHDVTMFLAGDAVYLLKPEVVAALDGIGTGSLAEHVAAVAEAGVAVFCSGMSAKGRGVTEDDLAATSGAFAMPTKLVELTFSCDRVLTY